MNNGRGAAGQRPEPKKTANRIQRGSASGRQHASETSGKNLEAPSQQGWRRRRCRRSWWSSQRPGRKADEGYIVKEGTAAKGNHEEPKEPRRADQATVRGQANVGSQRAS